MPTNYERREVAARLRELRGLDYCKDPRYAVELASDAAEVDHGNGYSWNKLLDRLADLIDPGSTCDRDALLELADRFEREARDASDEERRERRYNPEYSAQCAGEACAYQNAARRIREACGEVG